MVYKRIVEAFQHVVSKFLQFLFRQVQGFHQFIEHHLMDELADHRMLAGIAHDVDAGKVCHRREYGMRTVQQGYLPFVVRCFRRYEQHVQSGLVSREFGSHFLRCLNDPQVEDFGLYHHVVVILQLFLDGVDVLARKSRNDTVDQRGIYAASLFKPVFEAVAQVPEFDVLVDGFLQLVPVQENQFARENNQSLRHIALESLIAVIQ